VCRFKLKLLIFILSFAFLVCSNQKKNKTGKPDFATANWHIFRGDSNLSGVAKSKLPDNLSLLWSFQTGRAIVSSPVIGLERVYVSSTDGKVYSIKLADGSKIWEFDTGDDIEASPLLLGNIIYIGSLSGVFFALDANTGKVQWKYNIDNEIYGSANWAKIPASQQTVILVGSYDNKMYCFDANTGKLNWAYETGNYINGAPATDGEYVVFGGCDEKLHIVSALDGTKRGEVLAGSYIPGSAALIDGKAYLGHYGNKLICIDIENQKIDWEYQNEYGAPFFSSPAVGKDRVVIGSRDEYFHCVNRETGKKIWTFKTRDEIDSSPVIVDEKVVVGSTDGRLYIIDLKKGKELWSYEIGAAIIGCPAVAGGMIIIGAEDGRVYAFGEGS
jgi:outer membrane protein assembly factor BamB